MPRPSLSATLLVDGYNIIGAWSSLKKARDREGLDAARQALIENLVSYSAFQGFETQIVFDAHYQDTRSYSEVITQNLSIYFTEFRETADTYIERFCASFAREFSRSSQRLIVATSDRAQQLTITGFGAEWMSAQQLAFDVESAARRTRQRHKPNKQSSSRFLASSLDAKARQRLAEWRMGLR